MWSLIIIQTFDKVSIFGINTQLLLDLPVKLFPKFGFFKTYQLILS